MIKCNVSVCGKINRSAVAKKSKTGEDFISFGITIPVKDRNDKKKDFEISVSANGDRNNTSVYSTGRKVSIDGTLTIVKKNNRLYLNLRCDNLDLVKSTEPERIEGTMDFKGKIGKNGVEEKEDKKGNTYKVFSAFASDKDGEQREFTWVRFLYFKPKDNEDFLQAGRYIQAEGDMQLGLFNDELSLECRVSSVSEWHLEK